MFSPETPFGKVPILEKDGRVMHQSVAILRHLGRKYGLMPSDDQEILECDMLVETLQDARMRKFHFVLAFPRRKKSTYVNNFSD